MSAPTWLVQHEGEAAHIELMGCVRVQVIRNGWQDRDELAELVKRDVVVLAPDDPAGQSWVHSIHGLIGKRARSFTMVTPPDGRSIRAMTAADMDERRLPSFPLKDREPTDPAARALQRERHTREARRTLDEEETAAVGAPWAEPMTLGELIDNPPADGEPRVRGLMLRSGHTIIVAPHKAGKTTLLGNLLLALLSGGRFLAPDGDQFWDELTGFDVARPLEGRVLLMSYEMTVGQLRAWFIDMGLAKYRDRIIVWDLRGRRNPFASEPGRAELRRLVADRDIELVAIDTFTKAFTGTDQDKAAQVGPFLNLVDTVIGPGVDRIVTVHAGWNGNRARGSSALGDHPDTIITIAGEGADPRFLTTRGRDVKELDGVALAYDPAGRRVWLDRAAPTAGERADQRKARTSTDKDADRARIESEILKLLADGTAQTTTYIRGNVRGTDAVIGRVLREMTAAGRLLVESTHGGRCQRYRLNPDAT